MSKKHKDEDLIDVNEAPTLPPMTTGALEIVSHFQEIDALAQDHDRPSEALCAELYEAEAQKKAAEERIKKLKDVIKSFRDRGIQVYGSYTLEVKERAGSKTLDKDALFKRLTDELGSDEAKVYFDSCMKQGEPSVTISVKKISGDTCQGGGTGERA